MRLGGGRMMRGVRFGDGRWLGRRVGLAQVLFASKAAPMGARQNARESPAPCGSYQETGSKSQGWRSCDRHVEASHG
jgi:hypothetical protein